MVARLELTGEFLVNGAGEDTQGKRARKFDLLAIEKGRRMSRSCECTAAVGVEPERNAGGKAAVQPATEAAIEAG